MLCAYGDSIAGKLYGAKCLEAGGNEKVPQGKIVGGGEEKKKG